MTSPAFFRLSALALIFVAFFSCASESNAPLTLPTDQATLDLMERGGKLIAANCYSCHTTDADLNARLAPPMAAVKSHYLNKETTFATFTDELIRFVHKPSPVYSKMPGARKRFGLMPALPLPEDELQAIAAFIYYTDLEAPDWLEAHQREELATVRQRDTMAERGRNIAQQTKAILGKNLLQALNAGGAENAVQFCTTRAIPLTDSSANHFQVRVKRVSDRPRNPDNTADSLEMVQLVEIREDLAAGATDVYRLVEGPEAVTGYYPIVTNGMCLQCHGERGTQILPATLSALEALYPTDQATGYTTNQLRGIWVVTMPRKQSLK